MIGEAVKSAFGHACKATGLLALMTVTERANLGRLRAAATELEEALKQCNAVLNSIERKNDANT